MASELGLQYSVGRHWTGSMIELGYDRSAEFESTGDRWLPQESSSVYIDYRDIFGRRMKDKRGLNSLLREDYNKGSVLENLLVASAGNGLLDSKAKDVLQPTITKCLLQIIKDKSNIRHSLTSLLPTGELKRQSLENTNSKRAYERRPRCRSSEPETGRRKESISPNRQNRQPLKIDKHQLTKSLDIPITNPQMCTKIRPQLKLYSYKRISVSDTVISYNYPNGTAQNEGELASLNQDEIKKDQQKEKEEEKEIGIEESIPDKLNVLEQPEVIPVAAEATNNLLDSVEPTSSDTSSKKENTSEDDVTTELNAPVIFDNPEVDEPLLLDTLQGDTNLSSASPTSPSPSDQEDIEKPGKKPKKSVRFADDEGDRLTEEWLIPDTTLPPLLRRRRLDSLDDDFGNFGEHLTFPGQRGFSTFSHMNRKIPSLPNIQLPPPVPVIPMSSSTSSLCSLSEYPSPPETPPTYSWRLTFTQPAAQYLAFRQRLESNCISLENISVSTPKRYPQSVILYGTIKVKNIAFEKHVKLRLTRDKWATFEDYTTTHSTDMSSTSGPNQPFDAFIFNITIMFKESANDMQELQFTVYFQASENGAAGGFWCNSDGYNYIMVRQPTQSSTIGVGSMELSVNSPTIFLITRCG